MGFDDLISSGERIGLVAVAAVLAYTSVIVLTRLSGVRSLAKMSSFDFAATVAVGSTLSATLLGSVPTDAGLVGLVMLFGLQYAVATARRRGLLGGLVDNEPVLLMAHGEVLDDNLAHVRMSRSELWSQVRLAGVRRRDEVLAVVLETTGDVSVMRAGAPFDDEVLSGIRGAEALRISGGQGRP